MAQYTDKIKFGMQKSVNMGQIPFKAPMGYSHIRMNGTYSVSPNDDADLVKEAFMLYATNAYSINTLAQYLEEKYNRPLHRSNLHRVLKNIFYIGKILYKDREYDHAYTPLIDEETFHKVQEIISGKPRKEGISNKKHNHLYRKMLRCSQCNNVLVGDIKKGRYTYYICRNRYSTTPHKSITESTINDALKPALLIYKIDEKVFKNPSKMQLFLELVMKEMIGNTIDGTVSYTLKNISDVNTISSYINEDIVPGSTLKSRDFKKAETKIYGNNPICVYCKVPRTEEEIAQHLDKDIIEVQQLLFDLQIEDKIEQDESGRWKTL